MLPTIMFLVYDFCFLAISSTILFEPSIRKLHCTKMDLLVKQCLSVTTVDVEMSFYLALFQPKLILLWYYCAGRSIVNGKAI